MTKKTISISNELINRYMNKTKKNKNYKKKTGTLKNNYPRSPPVNIKKDKPYGNLKNGNKPTFREWKNKTQKKTSFLKKINSYRSQQKKSENKGRRCVFGKNQHNKSVSVLIKNNKTRKKQKKEIDLFKKKPILDIKKYLLKHSMLKSDSNAPEEVLRELYKQLITTGEVVNTNNNILLHNYFA